MVQRDAPLVWPLWLHPAAPGNVSLYIILYYEIENAESFIKYRTLRMFYNLEVCASTSERMLSYTLLFLLEIFHVSDYFFCCE